MKRAVIISGIQVFPPLSGGNVRTASLAEGLVALGYDVRIYSFTGRKEAYLLRARSWTYIPRPGVTEYVNRNIFWAFFQLLTYRFRLPDLWQSFPFAPGKLLKEWLSGCDLAVADFPFVARYLKWATGARRILNTHNLEHERWKGITALLVRGQERRAGQLADQVWVTSEREAEFFRKAGARNVVVVPNGIMPERFETSLNLREATRRELLIAEETRVILFTGSRYRPNVEAFQLLVKFAQTHSQWLEENHLLFLVVGSVSEALQAEGLIATGPVEDVAPFFAASDFAVNPVQTGSGTNVKMAEYLAARLPTLTTEFGCRGYDLLQPTHVLRFEPANLKQQIETLCAIPVDRLAGMARDAFLANQHSIDMRLALARALPQI